MIARLWHGVVPKSKADEYLRLMVSVALPDYTGIEGNCGAWCLHRPEGEVVHFEMLTFWDSFEAVRRFAGDPEVGRQNYAGNSATDTCAIPFKFFAANDIKVILQSASGVEADLVEGLHDTLSGMGNDSGGEAVLSTAPANGET